MDKDQTPINARPPRRQPEALEDASLAVRDNVLWPLEDRFLGLDDSLRAAVAGGAVVLALALGVGGYSLISSDGGGSTPAPRVAVTSVPTAAPAPVEPAAKPAPDPTLQGATPVFKAPAKEAGPQAESSKEAEVEVEAPSAGASNTGNAATDTISSTPTAQPAAGAAASTASVDGPPAGPAAVAVARKFAQAFVVYETGGEAGTVRKAFKATAVPQVTKALMERPPRQPAGVEVPKAKVLNVVPAPSHDRIYPVSVSLLRVGATSELRLEMEQLKNKQWRVVNVLG